MVTHVLSFFGIIIHVLGFLLPILIFILLYHYVLRRKMYDVKVAENGKKRDLGRYEYMYHDLFEKYCYQTCAVYVTESSSPIPDRHVVMAMEALASRHPLLRMKIQCDPDREEAHYEEMNVFRADYRTSKLLASREKNWGEIFTSEIEDKVNSKTGPLWRVCRLKEDVSIEGKLINCFVFTLEHAFCDGTSRLVIFKEFLDCLNCLALKRPLQLNPLQLTPPLDPLLMDSLRNCNPFQSFARELRSRLHNIGLFPLKPVRHYTEFFFRLFPNECELRPSFKGVTKAIFHTLDAAQTARYLAVCRQKSCTLTGTLVASMSMALAELMQGGVAQEKCTIPVSIPVNSRAHNSTLCKIAGIGDQVGIFTGELIQDCRIPSYDEDTLTLVFWENARKITQEIKTGLSKVSYLKMIKDFYGTLSKKLWINLYESLTLRYGRIDASIVNLSNNGRFDYTPKDTTVHVRKIFAGNTSVDFGFLFADNVTTVDGQLCRTFHYATNIISDELAAKYFYRSLDILDAAMMEVGMM